jgi:hypothetical protein
MTNYAPPFELPAARMLALNDATANDERVYGFLAGKPANSGKLLRIPLAHAVIFPINFAGSVAKASANATASTAIDIQKNGVSCGTLTFALGAAVGTFVTASGVAQSFAAGDVLALIGPAVADTTLADIGFTLVGQLTF